MKNCVYFFTSKSDEGKKTNREEKTTTAVAAAATVARNIVLHQWTGNCIALAVVCTRVHRPNTRRFPFFLPPPPPPPMLSVLVDISALRLSTKKPCKSPNGKPQSHRYADESKSKGKSEKKLLLHCTYNKQAIFPWLGCNHSSCKRESTSVHVFCHLNWPNAYYIDTYTHGHNSRFDCGKFCSKSARLSISLAMWSCALTRTRACVGVCVCGIIHSCEWLSSKI